MSDDPGRGGGVHVLKGPRQRCLSLIRCLTPTPTPTRHTEIHPHVQTRHTGAGVPCAGFHVGRDPGVLPRLPSRPPRPHQNGDGGQVEGEVELQQNLRVYVYC